MINVSNAFKQELYDGHRNYLEYVDITLKDGTELHLTNKDLWQGGITIEDKVSEKNVFEIGGAYDNSATFSLENIDDRFSDYDFDGADVIAYVGLALDKVDNSVGRNLFALSKAIDGTLSVSSQKPAHGDSYGGKLVEYHTAEENCAYTISINGFLETKPSWGVLCAIQFYDADKNPVGVYSQISTKAGEIHDSKIVTSPENTAYFCAFYRPTDGETTFKIEKGAVENPVYSIAPEDVRIEKIRKGTFTVNNPKYNTSVITIPCLGNMQKFDKLYSESKLSYPTTLNQIVMDACDVCDVTLQTIHFPHDDFMVQNSPSDEVTTFRDVISWAAQIAGCFAKCDVYGRLELKWYDQELLEKKGYDGGIFDKEDPSKYVTGDTLNGGSFNPWEPSDSADGGLFQDLESIHHIYSHYSAPDVSTDDVVITGIRVIEKVEDENDSNATVTCLSGAEGYVIEISGNDLIRDGNGGKISNWLGEQLIGFRFRRATITHASDPTIEAGDVGIVTNRKNQSFPIIISSTKFSTGGSQTTESSAATPAKNSSRRFSAETKNYVDFRRELQKEKTSREKAQEELKNRIDNSSGLFTTEQTQADGSKIYFMHDKPSLEESMIVWKMTAEAWGVSTDGGKSYNAGMTVDGNTIVRILNAVGINANWIKSGVFKIEKDGKVIFLADADTKQVKIVANSFEMSNGDTIDSIAQGKANTAANEALSNAKTYADQVAKNAVSGLSQTDILNKLTKNGEDNGIYLRDGKIYVSFSAARGGELTLGGANNINGSLKILDASGTEIGRWDNSGITLLKGEIKGPNIIVGGESNKFGSVTAQSDSSGQYSIFDVSGLLLNKSRIQAYSTLSDKLFGIIIEGDRIEHNVNAKSYLTQGTSNNTYGDGLTYFIRAVDPELKLFQFGWSQNGILYFLNNGSVINQHNENHIFYGTMYCNNSILCEANIRANSFSPGIPSEEYPCSAYLGAGKMDDVDVITVNNGNLYVYGDIGCLGEKNRIVETKSFGKIAMNAVESAEPYFSDIGSGTVGNNGEITIFFDPVFAETIDMDSEYQVFLTRTSQKVTEWVDKQYGYFIVHGEPGATFDWMVTCKQRDYSSIRMKSINIDEAEKENVESEEISFG